MVSVTWTGQVSHNNQLVHLSGTNTFTVNIATDLDLFDGNQLEVNIFYNTDGSNNYTSFDSFYGTDNTTTASKTYTVPSAGTYHIDVLVCDRRGYYETEGVSSVLTVINYSYPIIAGWKGQRCNSGGVEGYDSSSTYANVIGDWDSHLPSTGLVKWKEKGQSGHINTGLSLNNGQSKIIGSGTFSNSKTYTIDLIVTDGYYSATKSLEITSQPVTIDLKKGGKGVAFGKVAETDNLLDSAWPIKAPSLLLTTNPPANGGNADTVDGKHASDFLSAGGTAANSHKLGHMEVTQPGNRYGAIPYVETDGVMEVGAMIDFHSSDDDGSDFSQRLAANSVGLYQCNNSGRDCGYIGKFGTVRGLLHNNDSHSNIVGRITATVLGNGHFRFDVSGKWYVHQGLGKFYDYGIAKSTFQKAAWLAGYTTDYDKRVDLTSGQVGLSFNNYSGDLQLWNASGGAYGLTNCGYGWTLQDAGGSTIIVARMHTTNADVGGWEAEVINPAYPSGFFFRGHIFARLA